MRGASALAGVIILMALLVVPAWAHKDKLPADALTLVRQASALLAQSPGMTGEVRERVQAALRSTQTQGVHMDRVAEALRALDRKDRPAARRLLMESIMPAGMPMPPAGPTRAAAPRALPSTRTGAADQAGVAPQAGATLQAAPPTVETAMVMAETLRPRFQGSPVEVSLLVIAALLAGSGLWSLRPRREASP